MEIKKLSSRIFAVMLSAAMIIPAAQTALPVYASSCDGWTTNASNTLGALSGSAKTVFELAKASYSGEELEPLCCYATQLVAGENYYYICRQGSDLRKVCVYAHSDSSAEISSVTDFNLNDYSEGNISDP